MDQKWDIIEHYDIVRGIVVMRFPIKINRSRLPHWLHGCLPSIDDPRKLISSEANIQDYERSVSAIKAGKVWRTTKKRRHPLTDQVIIETTSSLPCCSILDVGASSGSTSLDLLKRLGENCKRYYVTDISFELSYVVQGNTTYLYQPNTKHCIMSASNWFIVYSDVEGTISPLGSVVTRLLSRAPRVGRECYRTVSLLHPELQACVQKEPRVRIVKHNVLMPWPYTPVDVIKAANVLNRSYFTDREISQALTHLNTSLKTNGMLLITENRGIEKVSVFTKSETDGYELQNTINGGSDITEIVCRLKSEH